MSASVVLRRETATHARQDVVGGDAVAEDGGCSACLVAGADHFVLGVVEGVVELRKNCCGKSEAPVKIFAPSFRGSKSLRVLLL